ncbi:MAG: type VI secretion system tube protein Hcp [candidate division Zixibacteria bacterium]|nr:type VI secretion system tube protein Hcp [candidate division Zixibacteria bacterium]
MPMPCYLTVAEYPGSCDQIGHEGQILVYSVHHNVDVPVDAQSGTQIGHRTHHPLKIMKVIDKSSPGLLNALTTAQRLSQVTLAFYRIDPTGVEQKYYTITLTNAVIVDISLDVPVTFDPQYESYHHMENVSFVYEQIEWEWIPDGVMEMDEWLA